MASTTPNQLLLSKWGMQVPALIALLLCFISAGCTPVALVNRPSPPIAMQVATFPEAKAMLSSTQLRPTPLTGNDSYQLTVDLDYPRRLLQVRAQIAYVNRTGVPLSELALVVEPNRSSGVFTLHNLSWGDGSAISNYSLRGPRLDIPLPTALKPVEKIELQVSYSLALPARPGYLGYSRRQMNVGDWVPFVPPYRPGTGWLIHDLAAVGEHTVYPVADYDILIKTTEGDNLVIAASAPGEKVADGIRFHLAEARNFAWSASPEYESSTIEVDGVTVAAYWFPEHAVAGQAALVATAQALRLYNDQFGPYPHPMLTNVEAEFADGMEYDGLYFLGKEYYAAYAGNPAGYLTMLAAHETAHQWWYGVIGNDQALEPYLDEAFATYSELLFYEALYPELIDWWWDYRVNRFDPAGCVGSTIYDHVGFRGYVNAVYLRGAQFLHELRTQLGEEDFRTFLKTYVAGNRGQQTTTGDFYAALRTIRPDISSQLFEPYCLPPE